MPPVSSVCKKMKCNWNRCKDGICSDILGDAGDLVPVKALGREQRVNRLPGHVRQWQEKLREYQRTKLWTHTGIQHTLVSLCCPLLLLYISLLCCLWCCYFWKHGDWKKKSHIYNALQGIVRTQTKNSPEPPSHSPLILSCPNCGCSHPRFTSLGEREREKES